MSLYDVIGVPMDATDTELTAAYRKRAYELHPDHHPDGSLAGPSMAELNEAWFVLRDRARRAAYDELLRDPNESVEPTEPRDFVAREFVVVDTRESRRWRGLMLAALLVLVVVLIVLTIVALAGSGALGPDRA